MANIFKSLFSGKKEEGSDKGKDKTAKKNFDILKYDGIRAQRIGKIDYAIKCYEKALDIEKDFEIMGYLSRLYIQTEAYGEAEKLLGSMIEMKPEVITTYLTLSNLYYLQEKYPEMVDILEKGIAVEDTQAVAHYLMAKAKRGINEHGETIGHLTRAITLQDDIIEPYLLRAEVLMEQGQYEDSLADIEKVLEIEADEEHALLLRARLKECIDKVGEAEQDYLRVIELNPFHDQAFIQLVRLYGKQAKHADAIRLCDEGIDFNPTSVPLYNERAKAKRAEGDDEGAEKDTQIAGQLMESVTDSKAGQPKPQEEETKNSLGLPFQ